MGYISPNLYDVYFHLWWCNELNMNLNMVSIYGDNHFIYIYDIHGYIIIEWYNIKRPAKVVIEWTYHG